MPAVEMPGDTYGADAESRGSWRACAQPPRGAAAAPHFAEMPTRRTALGGAWMGQGGARISIRQAAG